MTEVKGLRVCWLWADVSDTTHYLCVCVQNVNDEIIQPSCAHHSYIIHGICFSKSPIRSELHFQNTNTPSWRSSDVTAVHNNTCDVTDHAVQFVCNSIGVVRQCRDSRAGGGLDDFCHGCFNLIARRLALECWRETFFNIITAENGSLIRANSAGERERECQISHHIEMNYVNSKASWSVLTSHFYSLMAWQWSDEIFT